MAKKSRDKGVRFERYVAGEVGDAFGRKLRRVPLSGGLDIRCDIYDPENDDFPLFIECKHRETYRIKHLMSIEDSPLYETFMDTVALCEASYLCKKYATPQRPVLVFKGGGFPDAMAMFYCTTDVAPYPHFRMVHFEDAVLAVAKLDDFLAYTDKAPLKMRFTVGYEDDGEFA